MEGPLVVLEALRSHTEVTDVFVTDPNRHADVVRAGTSAGVDVWDVSPEAMRSLSTTVTPQGVVAVASIPTISLDDLTAADPALVLADVRDPGNAGTLLRSAVGAGAAAVVFAGNSVDPLHPKVVRASAGAVFSTQVVRTTSIENCASKLRALGVELVAALPTASLTADRADLTRPVAVVVGNEAWGLPDEVMAVVDTTVAIPMPGPLESLNVAVAGSILLYEIARQRR